MIALHPLLQASRHLGAAEAWLDVSTERAQAHVEAGTTALRNARRRRELRDQCAPLEVALAAVAARLEITQRPADAAAP